MVKKKDDMRRLGNSDSIGKSDRVGKSDSIGNSDRVGKSDSIGNSDRVGNSDSIGNSDLSYKRVRGRRDFMDLILGYVKENNKVSYTKLGAYFQYTTGASESMIKQALAVLENVGLIKSVEEFITGSHTEYFFEEVKDEH